RAGPRVERRRRGARARRPPGRREAPRGNGLVHQRRGAGTVVARCPAPRTRGPCAPRAGDEPQRPDDAWSGQGAPGRVDPRRPRGQADPERPRRGARDVAAVEGGRAMTVTDEVIGDERLARAAWSFLTEPGDQTAGALRDALGP